MKNDTSLPRETNMARILSQMARSLRKMRKAKDMGPSMRRDRTMAAWALSRKVRFVRVYNGSLRGAARMGALKKAAREYRAALAAWRGNYVKDSGW